eukprot:jgi/Picre1/33260/NNA_008584.t1
MAGKEVIRAVQVFSKEGMGSKVSVLKDIVIGSFLGVSLVWYGRHIIGRRMSDGRVSIPLEARGRQRSDAVVELLHRERRMDETVEKHKHYIMM